MDGPDMSDEQGMIPIYIMGKKYMVPYGLTIMKAMEYAGYLYTRGAGCRGGFCGACGTVFRFRDDFKLQSGLACQTVAKKDMYLVQQSKKSIKNCLWGKRKMNLHLPFTII